MVIKATEIAGPTCWVTSSVDRKPRGWPGPITGGPVEEVNAGAVCKRKCGCLRTSEKLKKILDTFPAPPPPTPMQTFMYDKACGYGYGHDKPGMQVDGDCCGRKFDRDRAPGEANATGPLVWAPPRMDVVKTNQVMVPMPPPPSKSRQVISELVTLVQLSVTATALALYYLIYCYIQLVYFTLKSALYFHNADGPMKISIAVVTVTSLIVGFNILMRMEGILGIFY